MGVVPDPWPARRPARAGGLDPAAALAELAEDGNGPDAITIPPDLARLIDELRAQLAGSGRGPTSSPPPAG